MAVAGFILPLIVASFAAGWPPVPCGGPGANSSIITQWGASLDVNNVLPEHPRPRFRRDEATWANLNGFWEFQRASNGEKPPFNVTLSELILVPFPVESCLSGLKRHESLMWYRKVFPNPFEKNMKGKKLLLHFGAVDWQTEVYLNGQYVGAHQGGYDSFTFDVTLFLTEDPTQELIVNVFDPTDEGGQPFGKQRVKSITNPGGDHYTPTSGIWQTVWLELVETTYIRDVAVSTPTTSTLNITVQCSQKCNGNCVNATIWSLGDPISSFNVACGEPYLYQLPFQPVLWSPENPFLYDLTLQLSGDSTDLVYSYFGVRTVGLLKVQLPRVPATGMQVGVDRPGFDLPGFPVTLSQADPNLCQELCLKNAKCKAWAYGVPSCGPDSQAPRCWLKGAHAPPVADVCRVSGDEGRQARFADHLALNGAPYFVAGWLDQGWWPDGLYTAPADEALQWDIISGKMFGFNGVRKHQKTEPERWYYHADRLGFIVLQDMIQHFSVFEGHSTPVNRTLFRSGLERMISQYYSFPSIIQWDIFNEEDCVGGFSVEEIKDLVDLVTSLDPTRLVDTNSGGPANDLHIGDVNDVHTYPNPGSPSPSDSQYAMVGEFGGLGYFIPSKEWVPNGCYSYERVQSLYDYAQLYVNMTAVIAAESGLSVSIYTQISDVELECDGFLNYDRTVKFTQQQIADLAEANRRLVNMGQ